MAAAVEAGDAEPVVGEIEPLFKMAVRRYVPTEPGAYAVGPEGRRLLVNRVLGTGTTSPLALIVGWPEELEVR